MACSDRALPWLCCPDCLLCSHRAFDDAMVELWSANMRPANKTPPCQSHVIDMQVRGGVLYLFGWEQSLIRGVVQAWDTATGTLLWSVSEVDLPSGIGTFFHIDSDGTQVWLCGVGEQTLIALDASDGSLLWSVSDSVLGNFDVESDGSGGVYVARHFDATENPSNECTEAGYVSRYNSSGTLVSKFGGASGTVAFSSAYRSTSLLFSGGKLWVGSEPWTTVCLCANAEAIGHLARYSGTTLEILTGHLDPPLSVNRLAMTPGGRLFAAYHGEGVCDLVEFDPDTGEVLNGVSLTPSSSNVVFGNALAAGTDFLAVATAGYLWKLSLAGAVISVRKNIGEDLNSVEREGSYGAVTVDGDDSIYAGGTTAGCTIVDDAADGAAADCEVEQECDCGDVGPDGGIITSCGCYDGTPCSFTQPGAGAGCLACQADQTVSWVYDGFEGPRWVGTANWCCSDPDGVLTLTVAFDCATDTWSATAEVTAGAQTWGPVDVPILDQWCGPDAPDGEPQHPWCRGFYEVTSDDTTNNRTVFACCDAGETACLGFGAGACEPTIDACGCTGIPETLTATMTGCASLVVTLTHAGGHWTGSTDAGGGCTWDLDLWCASDEWHINGGVDGKTINQDGFAVQGTFACNPLSTTFTGLTLSAPSGTCCGTNIFNVAITE